MTPLNLKMNYRGALSYKKILVFWLPLLATWLMMSSEGPFLSALISRLPEPKFNLAAYGVAFAIALIVESPVIMMLSASTALVKDWNSYVKLRNFITAINVCITAIMLIITYKPIFLSIAVNFLNLPHKVAYLTHKAALILLPWPAAIGFRRFYQGVLIRNNLTRRVAYGTILRLLTMISVALLFYFHFNVDGVVVGAAALSAGVVLDSLASRWMTNGTIKKISSQPSDKNSLSYSEIWKFYYPLVIMSFLSLSVQPIVTFFLGYSVKPLESLAVLPVINSLVFIFRAFGLSFQEVIIALVGEQFENFKELKNFSIYIAAFVFLALSLISFTQLNFFWFHQISGLTTELTRFARLPLIILTLMPVLTMLISFQRAILVSARVTKPITVATIVEVSTIALFMTFFIKVLPLVGMIAAAIALLVGRLMANSYLMFPLKRVIKKQLISNSP